MAFTLGDLFRLPGAINDELDRRSKLRAEAAAAKLLNKISPHPVSPDPLHFNPYYHDDEQSEPSHADISRGNADNTWGSNGW